MRIYLSKDSTSVLKDVCIVADHNEIQDNSELYLVFNTGGDAWESIDIAALNE
jgi:hypothetical protein